MNGVRVNLAKVTLTFYLGNLFELKHVLYILFQYNIKKLTRDIMKAPFCDSVSQLF